MAEESRQSKLRELIARGSAITVIVVLGAGLASVYGELTDEREAGVERTAILERLQKDNAELQRTADALQRDNDALHEQLNRQSILIAKLARGEKVTSQELNDAIKSPDRTVIIRPKVTNNTQSEKESSSPPSATPTPKPTVNPAPTIQSTPSPTPTPLVCVPVLNLCL